jgi:Flp pilus assembly protein TadD
VREASKFVGLAMTKQNPAERLQQYQLALPHLREAMVSEPQNSKVWRLAGEVLAAVGEMAEADQAFTKAVELDPASAEDVMQERKRAWAVAFETASTAMEAQQFDEAIRLLQGAELLYQGRPEGLMNLGLSHANKGNDVEAIEALTKAVEAARGPLFATLTDEEKAAWTGYRVMAATNISILGVQSFQAEDFVKAGNRFRTAAQINPHGRDHWYNLAQSLRAQAAPLEEQAAAGTNVPAETKQQLLELSRQILAATEKARAADPNNEILYLVEARAHRTMGVNAATEADKTAAQQASLKLLEQHDALTLSLDEVGVVEAEEGVTIRGTLKNRKLTAGAPVNIKFTLLDLDGNVVGEQTITVPAPAVDAAAPFEAKATPSAAVAGWKYTIG